MPEPVWNARDQASRQAFMSLLAPLVMASRCRDFDDPASARVLLSTWMRALSDVGPELLAEGIDRLLPSVTWMPKPGEVRAACCDVVDARRRKALQQAAALRDGCDCSEGWRYRDDGRVERCQCWLRTRELVEAAGQPLTRPALPAASEEVA